MSVLACRDDTLVKLLNKEGYQPILLPRSNVLPPDVYLYEGERLKRWGPLAPMVPSGALPALVQVGALTPFEYRQTSNKHAKGAASFMANALACIGVGGTPKIDLSVAAGERITFSFGDTMWKGLNASDVAGALQKGFDPSGIPPEQIRLGMVHIAYEYAYAGCLLMTVGDKQSGSAKLRAADIEGMVEVGAEASASLVDGSTVRFRGKRDPVAFACKVGQIKSRRGGGWNFYVREAPGFGATADESAGEPYMMQKGAVLIVEDLQS